MTSFADHAKQFLGKGPQELRPAVDSTPIDSSAHVDHRSRDAIQLTPEQIQQLRNTTNYRPTKSVVGSVTPEQKKRVAELWAKHEEEMKKYQGNAMKKFGKVEDLSEEEFGEMQTLLNEFLEEEKAEPEHTEVQ
jgi:hypothetical protein